MIILADLFLCQKSIDWIGDWSVAIWIQVEIITEMQGIF
jgi:hypothetical protein